MSKEKLRIKKSVGSVRHLVLTRNLGLKRYWGLKRIRGINKNK